MDVRYVLTVPTIYNVFYHPKVILGFPTNQFGHQENSSGETEIMNALKHVRPGNGFEPKCIMFDKVNSIHQW